MKTLILGGLAGMLTGLACAGVLGVAHTPLIQVIGVALLAAIAVSMTLWALGAMLSMLRWMMRRPEPEPRVIVREHVEEELPDLPDADDETVHMDEIGKRPANPATRSTPRGTPRGASRGATRSPPSSPPSDLAQGMREAEIAIEQGDFRAAADRLSDLLDLTPEDAPARLARGRVYLDLSDFNRAMSDFLIAEEAEPDSPEPQVAIGDLYFARKDYDRAIEYFDGALALAPNHAMARCRRGLSHHYRKRFAEAVADLEQASRLDPDIPNLATYLAQARRGLDPKAKARKR